MGSLGNFGGVVKYSLAEQIFWYVQDDWRVSSRLTLNLGVRFKYQSPYRGRLANFDLSTGRQLITGTNQYYIPGQGLFQASGIVLSNPPVQTDANNYGPRIGLAYRIGNNTMVRSGFCVFYAYSGGGATVNNMQSTPHSSSSMRTQSPARPHPRSAWPTCSPPPRRAPQALAVIRILSSAPATVQLQSKHPASDPARAACRNRYMGNTGQKQYGSVLLNQPRLPADPNNPSPYQTRMPYPSLPPGFSQNTNYQWTNYCGASDRLNNIQ